MDQKLESFAAECSRILKSDPGQSGIDAVSKKLEPLLVDADFVATYLGPNNDSPRTVLYEDSDLGFCILAHVFKGASSAPPHDHGPAWAIYGQAVGQTEMTEYDMVSSPSGDEPGQVKVSKTYMLEPGMAVAYPKGALHAPTREYETRLIRMEGQNLDGVKRDKYALA
jgi:predicted metal-dependent enzyme (double-stranded beta helix superfamily)